MARLPGVDREDLPEEAGRVLAELEHERGFVPNLYLTAANAPHFLPAFVRMVATSRAESALPTVLKELAVLEIAKLTRAETMWASHLALARSAGLSGAIIGCLPAWQDIDSAEHRAVLALADEATRNVRVSAETWSVAASLFDDEQLAELVFVIAFYNMVARILEPLEVDLDPRYVSQYP